MKKVTIALILLVMTASGFSGCRDKQEEITYTCPMHPEVEQKGPGQCPKCGMNLEKKK